MLKVTIQDTQDIIFEGIVERITSFNEVGRFDIYPMHANFISILAKEIALYQKKQKIKEIKFDQAVMKVKQDTVEIFVGIELLLFDRKESAAEKNPNPQK